jgi:hypothetical protein
MSSYGSILKKIRESDTEDIFNQMVAEIGDRDVSIHNLEHAWRLNGLVDVWKTGGTMFTLAFQEYTSSSDCRVIFQSALKYLEGKAPREVVVKPEKITYQQFKRSLAR